jgi:hypothetical protein
MFNKIIKSKIERPYFFYTGKIKNINSKYFIKKIDEGCNLANNHSFKTNVIGEMTNFKFFNKDTEFLKLLFPFFDVIDKEHKLEKYTLCDSWGIKNNFSCYTAEHSHGNNLFSGVIYLHDHPQLLEFPEIGEKIKPDTGSFVIFTSFLRHSCKRNLINKTKYALSFNIAHDRF